MADILTAPKPRSVLAMLMLQPGRAVSTASLIQELWDESPPRSAATTLQTYILKLRRMFRGIAQANNLPPREVLVTRVPGYLLQVDSAAHDLSAYESLVAQGQALLAQGDYERSRDLLSRALGLWRGAPLSDVRPGPLLYPQICGLEESRLTVTEMRIEAELRLGHHHAVQRELAVLVGSHPFHEGIRVMHMLALFQSGRLSAALESFHQYRHHVATELGLEPSPRIRGLQQAMLSFDPMADSLAILDRV
ncbi:AfsR/SARP family transcriptional regulator [Streptomyces cylindrosporus]|uniref:AfsR/SARP family transcriptional regulator n=1 Tax=Streptomyces cylindrosporus TaxID=2927583 RepID=A0ABS9YCV5_9ACTN|nr:AfsR/SARP family transcriptional regulator [Streptomyces cylindrosporus]MCI3275048.1 AfsR/SARP family transcriptional regulator [Streptomyces cylindrosporus]